MVMGGMVEKLKVVSIPRRAGHHGESKWNLRRLLNPFSDLQQLATLFSGQKYGKRYGSEAISARFPGIGKSSSSVR